ncbi:MAG TPA: hypothetical protein VMM13_01655 [Euzebya sp.]|nr:hypothetical protein [Euzebya sp.]
MQQRRLIIGNQQSSGLSVGRTTSATGSRPGGPDLRHRTPAYMAAIQRLDSGQITDTAALTQLIAEIKAELGELGMPSLPAGMVAECFLGPPYRVHTLDLVGEIVTHYEAGKAMPHPFERARSLALHPAYVLVEVHDDHMVAIRDDGTATTV